MTKCDWCEHSRRFCGRLICPFTQCILSGSELKEILDALSKIDIKG